MTTQRLFFATLVVSLLAARLPAIAQETGGDTRLFASRDSDPDFAATGREFAAKANFEGDLSLIVQLDVPDSYPVEEVVWNSRIEAEQAAMDAAAQADFADAVRDLVSDSAAVKTFEGLPFVQLRADATLIERIFSLPQVVSVGEEGVGKGLLNDTIPLIDADTAYTLGATGSGQTVAILDSGVETSHPFFTGKIVSQACYSSSDAPFGPLCAHGLPSGSTATGSGDPIKCTSNYSEECWHGTHNAGVAVGKSTVTGGYTLRGVGTSAKLIAIQVFSTKSSMSLCYPYSDCPLVKESNLVSAMNRVYALRHTYAIASVNISLTTSTLPSDWSAAPCDVNFPLSSAAVNKLVAANIAVVAASGNVGDKSGYQNKLAPPACLAKVISVGAVSKADVPAPYSNADSYLSILAPGGYCTGSPPNNCGIRSSLLGGVFGNATSIIGTNRLLTGTSQAAAHVSGAIAAIRTLYPAASPSAMKTQFQNTGVSKSQTQNGTTYNFKRIDLADAIAGPTAPGVPPSLTVSPEHCFGDNDVSWTAPTGTVTEYHLQGSSYSTFLYPDWYYIGSSISVLISVTGTTYLRVQACNLISCGGWRTANRTATYTNGCQ